MNINSSLVGEKGKSKNWFGIFKKFNQLLIKIIPNLSVTQ